MHAIPGAAMGFYAIYGLSQVYDSYKYRSHPDESVAKEAMIWGGMTVVWSILWVLSHPH